MTLLRMWIVVFLLLKVARTARYYDDCENCHILSTGKSCKSLLSDECYPGPTCDIYSGGDNNVCVGNICGNQFSLCPSWCSWGFTGTGMCRNPTVAPTFAPTSPTKEPTLLIPTEYPTGAPDPTLMPTLPYPTEYPTKIPTVSPTKGTYSPTLAPTPGYSCKYDFQCGYLAANAPLLIQSGYSEYSLTSSVGKCENKNNLGFGTCTCNNGYELLPNCALNDHETQRCCTVKENLDISTSAGITDSWCMDNCGSGSQAMNCGLWCNCLDRDPSNPNCVDWVTIPFGGGPCDEARHDQCYNGLCIAKRCVCYKNWGCAFCTLESQDMKIGAKCADGSNKHTYTKGGGVCEWNHMDEFSQCGGKDGVAGKCQCQDADPTKCRCLCTPSFGCSHCTQPIAQLIAEEVECGCESIVCASGGFPPTPNGRCIGNGECACYTPWSGIRCETNACMPNPCKDGFGSPLANTVCIVDERTGLPVCECINGYSGNGCGVAPVCSTDYDCGNWGPVNEHTADPYFACNRKDEGGSTCLKTEGDEEHPDRFGGRCVDGTCQCAHGFTCAKCTAMAPPFSNWETGGAHPCEKGTGGGACTSHAVCRQITDGAYCFDGRCVCPAGFTCPLCNMQQNYVNPSQYCPEVGYFVAPTPVPITEATSNYYSWQAYSKYPTPAPKSAGGGGDDDDDPADLIISAAASTRPRVFFVNVLLAASVCILSAQWAEQLH